MNNYELLKYIEQIYKQIFPNEEEPYRTHNLNNYFATILYPIRNKLYHVLRENGFDYDMDVNLYITNFPDTELRIDLIFEDPKKLIDIDEQVNLLNVINNSFDVYNKAYINGFHLGYICILIPLTSLTNSVELFYDKIIRKLNDIDPSSLDIEDVTLWDELKVKFEDHFTDSWYDDELEGY